MLPLRQPSKYSPEENDYRLSRHDDVTHTNAAANSATRGRQLYDNKFLVRKKEVLSDVLLQQRNK
jgi:hypothetical protein